MDIIFEFIIELLLEGTITIGTSKKVPKLIRYPLLTLIIIFYVSFCLLFVYIGLSILKENEIGGIIILIIAAFLIIGTIYMFYKKIKESR